MILFLLPRFCSIANLFVKRVVDGKQVDAAGPWAKGSVRDSKATSFVKDQLVQPKEELLGKSSVRNIPQSTSVSSEKIAPDAFDKAANFPLLKESAACGNTSKNKRQNEKGSSGTGSLASLWSNASAKPKAANPGTGTTIDVPVAAGMQTNSFFPSLLMIKCIFSSPNSKFHHICASMLIY